MNTESSADKSVEQATENKLETIVLYPHHPSLVAQLLSAAFRGDSLSFLILAGDTANWETIKKATPEALLAAAVCIMELEERTVEEQQEAWALGTALGKRVCEGVKEFEQKEGKECKLQRPCAAVRMATLEEERVCYDEVKDAQKQEQEKEEPGK